MSEVSGRPRAIAAFVNGFGAGLLALIAWFVVWLGGLAPFPPDSALTQFISIIPESIQEPAVQVLGEAAGLLGLAVAVLIAAAVYGLLGVVYEEAYLPRSGVLGRLTSLEKALLYSLVPWLFFGLVVLPLTGSWLFGEVSSSTSPGAVWVFPLTTLALQLLWGLLVWQRRSRAPSAQPREGRESPKAGVPTDLARRTFIETGLILAGSAVLVLLGLGSAIDSLAAEVNLVSRNGAPILSGSAFDLQSAPTIFDDPRLSALVNSEVTSNDSFYRVAIDIFDPSIQGSTWSLPIVGLVANPKTYTLPEIKSLPKVEEYSTFICVSNLINGGLVSNTKWGGVRISDLLADAGGITPEAMYVVFYSIDGYSVGVPLARAMDPSSVLAYEMNGEALPQRHGYPLRAVVPGLYGMMSAKWLKQIEVLNQTYVGYWQTRGWSNDAVVQTVSFIRIPQDGESASLSQYGGSVMLGGFAFAGNRGVSRVEVSVDGGSTWQQATLKPPSSALAWVLWAYDWTPPGPGKYVIYVRATDGKGDLQTSATADSFPSGATGYAMSTVNVVA